MRTSLWKDHSESSQSFVDLASLRHQYVADGSEVAERLKRDDNVLAVWLSGPFDRSRVSPGSDLHIAVLVRRGRGIVYNHLLPHFSEVPRRLEIALFTDRYLHSVIERGYSKWSEVFDLYKLRDVEVLYDRDGVLDALRRDAEGVRPRRVLVGEQIELIRKQLTGMELHMRSGSPDDAILHARKVVMSSLMLYLLTVRGCMSSRISYLYPELKLRFPPTQMETFDNVQVLAELDETEAANRIEEIRDFTRKAFDRRRVEE